MSQTMKFLVADLRSSIKANREKHYSEYLQALEGYRQELIVLFTTKLQELQSGKVVSPSVDLVAPVNMTHEYDTILGMLNMTTDQHIELNNREFNSYVLDRWDWKVTVDFTNSKYFK